MGSLSRRLQDFDLEPFQLFGLSPYLTEVKKIINEREQSAILYCFHHHNGEEHCVVDGLLLATGPGEGYQELKRWYVNQNWRAASAFEEAIRYVTNQPEQQ